MHNIFLESKRLFVTNIQIHRSNIKKIYKILDHRLTSPQNLENKLGEGKERQSVNLLYPKDNYRFLPSQKLSV